MALGHGVIGRYSSQSTLVVFRWGVGAMMLYSALSQPVMSQSADQDWYFEENFDSEEFRSRFSADYEWNPEKLRISSRVAPTGSLASLEVRIPAGSHTGANFYYNFEDNRGNEPLELYSRYYLWFDPTWKSGQGGKLPGPSGTYNRAGWGGRPANGGDGWSARMGFHDSWWEGEIQLSYYTYHMDSPGRYGEHMNWDRGTHIFGGRARGSLEPDRWYCIESRIRLNQVGKRDGLLEGWVDGELAMRRKGLRFRDVAAVRIEKYWFNVYYGGTGTPDRELQLAIDDFAMGSHRIGCLEDDVAAGKE